MSTAHTVMLYIIAIMMPRLALKKKMTAAVKDGWVHSRAFESQYGWLCARYRASCYYWELLFLEYRLVTIVASNVAEDGADAAYFCTGITLVMLALQYRMSPFLTGP